MLLCDRDSATISDAQSRGGEKLNISFTFGKMNIYIYMLLYIYFFFSTSAVSDIVCRSPGGVSGTISRGPRSRISLYRRFRERMHVSSALWWRCKFCQAARDKFRSTAARFLRCRLFAYFSRSVALFCTRGRVARRARSPKLESRAASWYPARYFGRERIIVFSLRSYSLRSRVSFVAKRHGSVS